MWNVFLKGGPLMWPLLATSILTLTIIIERILFLVAERRRRQPEAVQAILAAAEHGDVEEAVARGRSSADPVARVLCYGLEFRQRSLAEALLHAAGCELARFNRGLAALDTVVTLAPLLGLLGTVTGMIRAFGLLGAAELAAPVALTGGIAEALIATAFGLGIAILALVPCNYMNAQLESARSEIEAAATQLQLVLGRTEPEPAPSETGENPNHEIRNSKPAGRLRTETSRQKDGGRKISDEAGMTEKMQLQSLMHRP